MRWVVAWAGVVLAGCAPPPPAGGSGGPPTIHMLYPAPGNVLIEDDEGGLHMKLDPDGALRFTAVVAIENLEFRPPADEVIEGVGHWHLFLNGAYVAPSGLYYEAEFPDQTPDAGGTLHTIKVQLQEANHSEMSCLSTGECTDDDVQDSIEFTLDPPDEVGDTDA